MKRLFFFMTILSVTFFSACTDDDSFGTNRSDILTFSTDTVNMDTLFSTVPTSTYNFWVYNNSGDGIRLRKVRLQRGNQTGFRVNVDGEYLDNALGSQVSDIEIRKGDSVRVFVELTSAMNNSDTPQLVEDNLLFNLESGVEQSVCLRAYSWDALLCDTVVIKKDSVISGNKPIVIRRGLSVDSGATLTINAPACLYFHDGAGIDVYGRLIVNKGNVGNDVVFRGDRTDRMFDYLPYDRVSGQWRGIRIHSSSSGNYISNADIHSAEYGVVCDSAAYDQLTSRLTLENVIIHNCKGTGVETNNSNVTIVNSQITNTLGDCVAIHGGSALIVYCTIAQFYPFSADRGAALRFTNFKGEYDYPLHALECYNTLVTGYAGDVVYGETKDTTVAFSYYFANSILRTEKPDSNMINSGAYSNIIWETPKDTLQGKGHFILIDEENMYYNFKLDSMSTARGNAMPIGQYLTDRIGKERGDTPDIGCYQYVDPKRLIVFPR